MKIKKIALKMIEEGTIDLDISENHILGPELVAKAARKIIGDKDREYLIVFLLNTKNKITSVEISSEGSLNSSIVHPREVFKAAVLANAASIIIAHNHPSGDTEPSEEDINITRRIYEASKILGIELLDHIIVGFNTQEYCSLHREGIIL